MIERNCRHLEEAALEPGLRGAARDHVVERLLEHARHRGQRRRARLLRVVDELVDRLGEDLRQPRAEPGALDDLRERVREGQEQGFVIL